MLSSQLISEVFKEYNFEGDAFEKAIESLREKERYLDGLENELCALSSAQEIIDAASVYTNNPFFYLDRDYSILAMTKSLEFEYDEEWIFMRKYGYLSPLTARLMKEAGNLSFLAQADEPVLFNNPLLFPFSSINCNVRHNGEFAGRLNMLGAVKNLNALDMESFKIIMKHLVRLLEEKDAQKNSGYLKRLFKDILSGTSYSRGHIENILIESNFPVNVLYALYAADTNSHGDPQVPAYYESALERVMAGEKVIIFTYGDTLIMIACAHTEKGFSPIEFKLNAFLNTQGLAMGAGNYFDNMEDIFGIYSQALSALRLGKGAFTRYKDVMVENLLSYIPDRDIRYIISDDIFRILDAQKECSFSMMETLKAYLENALSLQKTADALFIHKNTMLYRLGKIKEVLSYSLDDPEEALRLTLSIKLWERASA